jgi:hypothetical protein
MTAQHGLSICYTSFVMSYTVGRYSLRSRFRWYDYLTPPINRAGAESPAAHSSDRPFWYDYIELLANVLASRAKSFAAHT